LGFRVGFLANLVIDPLSSPFILNNFINIIGAIRGNSKVKALLI